MRGLACEMKSVASIDDDTLYVNGWGFSQNQPGTQIPTVDFAQGLKLYDKNGDGSVGRDEIAGDDRMSRILRPEAGYDAFDGNRDKKMDAKEWDVFRAMLAAENGLLAIRLGGRGDLTDSAVKWKYTRPVPQVPSTLLYQGVLYMVNDSGILLSFDPKTGGGPQAGPSQRRDRQIFRVADRRRRQGVAGQPGRDHLGRERKGRVGDARREHAGR